MKLVVFAHTPPPHHGQSFMVQLMLNGLGGDRRGRTGVTPAGAVECFHVNARYSDDIGQIGRAGWRKFFRAVRFAAEAIWCRLRYRADCLYYVPAPADLRAPLYRDWLVLALCRPFFRRVIFHWHSAGLGAWVQQRARGWERRLTLWVLGRPDLSMVLGEAARPDAVALGSRVVAIVPNGIPDPCPTFDAEVAPRRIARATALAAAAMPGSPPLVAEVLFLSLCSRDKGLFDAMEAVARLNRQLAGQRAGLGVRLNVAGKFWREEEEREFNESLVRPDLVRLPDGGPTVRYLGFISGDEKQRLLAESDCLCFPTYYSAESFPVVLLEAMAFGLPVVTTRWRNIPEMLPPGSVGLVDPQSPDQIAAALLSAMQSVGGAEARHHFLGAFTEQRFAENVRRALRSMT